jgi:NADPH-dependent glutamate synthase beta subunit-like oxidoreductase
LFNEEGYHAVLIATGAGLPKFLGVPGYWAAQVVLARTAPCVRSRRNGVCY